MPQGNTALGVRPGPALRQRWISLKTFKVKAVIQRLPFPAGFKCGSPEEVVEAARAIFGRLDADREHVVLLALNNKNRLNGYKIISTGSLTNSIIHPREVWRAALYLCAAAVIVVHNHPSGTADPSFEDQEITWRLKKNADLLGIRMLDHLIIGEQGHFSFSDRGLMDEPLAPARLARDKQRSKKRDRNRTGT